MSLVCFGLGSACVHNSVHDCNVKAAQKLAARWASHAFAGVREIARSVGRALQVAAVGGEKTVFDPVQGDRHVTAAVYVRVKPAFVVNEETLLLVPVDVGHKLARGALGNVACVGDRDPIVRVCRHGGTL